MTCSYTLVLIEVSQHIHQLLNNYIKKTYSVALFPFSFFSVQLVIRVLSRLLLCHCRPAEGKLPALIMLFVEVAERSGLRWYTVLICSSPTVLLPLSLWRSAIP